MADSALIGELVGAGVVCGSLGYFVVHKVIERLQVIHDADAAKARKLYRLRPVVLLFAALLAAVLGVAATRTLSSRLARADDQTLAAAGKEGIATGCRRTCNQHSAASDCAKLCDCLVRRIEAKYPEATAFVNFMKLLGTDPERLRAELAPMQAACAAENGGAVWGSR